MPDPHDSADRAGREAATGGAGDRHDTKLRRLCFPSIRPPPRDDLDRHFLRGQALIGDAIAKVAIDNASFDPTFCYELFNK